MAARRQHARGGPGHFRNFDHGAVTYIPLGIGTRIAGGWELTGLTLPASGHLRARARIAEGAGSSSSGLVEATASFGLPATPEIGVEQPAGINLVDGNATVAFGTVDVATPSQPVTFIIRNAGGADLALSAVTLNGAQAGDFNREHAGLVPRSGRARGV